MEKKNFKVHALTGRQNIPHPHELSAAAILAQHFKADVHFMSREILKTPDLKINNQYWELKSPINNGKKTIENCLRDAAKQSQNVILDLRRFPSSHEIAVNKTKYFIKCTPNKIKKIIFITKSGKIIDKI